MQQPENKHQPVDEIKTSENELEKYRDRLEELVKERTAELEKANEVLLLQVQERKNAEEALRESEEKYRQLFETEMDAIMIFDDETRRFLDVNDAAIHLYGYCRDEFLKLTQTDITAEKEASDAAIKQTSERHPVRIPLRYHKKKDGTIFSVEISGSSFHLNGRKVICGVVRDITERKEAEESLHESENRYKAVVDNAQEGIVVVQDKKLQFINPSAMSMLDYTEEELTSRSFIEYVHPDDRDRVMDIHVRRFKGEGVPPVYECRIVDKHGNARWAENNGILIEWEGRPATLNFLRDITERKKAEKELKENEERFRSLSNAAFEGIVITKEGRFVDANAAFTDLFGYEPDEITGKEVMMLVAPEDRKLVMEKIRSGYEKPYEHKALRKDGSVLDVDVCGKTVQIKGQECRITAVRDITERKKAEKELKKQKYYLEKAQDIGRIGTWELDIEKNILVWTDENHRIFGIPKGTELTYEVFLKCIHPDDREYVDKKWKAALNKEAYDIEHRILVDGEVKWVREKAEVEFDEKGNCVRAIGFTQDITGRKQIKKALEESEKLHRNAVEVAGAVPYYLSFDPDVYQSVGSGIEAMTGYSPEEFTPQVFHSIVQEGILHGELKGLSLEEAEKKVRCEGVMSWRADFRIKTRDGQERWLANAAFHARDDGGNLLGIYGILQDITDRKKAEDQLFDYQRKLKSLASQLSITEESERRRIATELHDQIGQSLVFSKLKLDELHQTATSSELTKALDEICHNIDQVIQDTRTLTFDLSSPILNEIGFEAAVAEWLDVQVGEKHGIETEFVDDGQEKPLDDDIRALLFRNVRELLVNVMKHAEADKVKVSIRRINEHIDIDVEDDGKGFDCVKAISTGIEDTKFGLFSIRQRLEQLGGQFEIDTEEGRGSKIMMTAPLKLAEAESNLQNS